MCLWAASWSMGGQGRGPQKERHRAKSPFSVGHRRFVAGCFGLRSALDGFGPVTLAKTAWRGRIFWRTRPRAWKAASVAFDFGEAAKIRTPFTPGSGGVPPHLAGRAPEKQHLLDCFAQLRGGTPPASPLILWGPRGNGKTCLLFHVANAIERVSRTGGMRPVQIVRISPKGCHSEAVLRRRLLQNAPEAVAIRASRSLGGELSVGVAKGRGGRRLETESRIAPQSLDALLADMAGEQPVLLIVDEAHVLSPGMAGMLLDMD